MEWSGRRCEPSVSEDSLRYAGRAMSGSETVTQTVNKPRRATALPPDERRSMIVAATLPLLLEHGDRVTSRQIAEAAGIAEGTIFRAFADKDEIIVAVIEAALDPQPLEARAGRHPAGLGFEDALAAAVVIIQQRVIDVWRLVSSVGTRFHEMTRRPDGRQRRARAHLRRVPRRRSRSSRSSPRACCARSRCRRPTRCSPASRRAPDELVQLFLHGVGGGRVVLRRLLRSHLASVPPRCSG